MRSILKDPIFHPDFKHLFLLCLFNNSGFITEETAELLSQDGCGDPDFISNDHKLTIRKKRSHRRGESRLYVNHKIKLTKMTKLS